MFLASNKCKQCDEVENELVNVRDDLVESLGSWVVKSVNSQLVRLYDPSKEPAIVFFRHGVPLLYEGKLSILQNHIQIYIHDISILQELYKKMKFYTTLLITKIP